MSNKSVSNNSINEIFGIQRSEDDMSRILVESTRVFAQSLSIFMQSSGLLPQSIEKLI
jgi:hypothetical protein